MKLIGITGGIASGKSAVTAYLRSRGFKVICADEVSRNLSSKGQPGYNAIKRAFGDAFFAPDGELDRKKLGEFVFGNPSRLVALNAAIHPAILDAIRKEAEAFGGTVFIDAALLIETGLYRDMDAVWLITADADTRLKRLVMRDGITESDAEKRIGSQMPDGEKAKFVDAVIDNSGELETTIRQVQGLLKNI